MPSVPIDSVKPDPNQPRKHFDEDSLKKLQASIRTHGLLQWPVVTPDSSGQLIIVAGERRYRACKALGWASIPVIIDEIKHPKAVQLVENLQREDLTALEEAQAIKSLLEEHGHTQKMVARLLNKSPSYVSERLALLSLPTAIQELVIAGELSFSHAKLLKQAPAEEQEQLAKDIADSGDSVSEAKEKVRASKNNSEDNNDNPDKLVANAKKKILKASKLVVDALHDLSRCADGYEKPKQFQLADVVELLETADTKLEQFQKEEKKQ